MPPQQKVRQEPPGQVKGSHTRSTWTVAAVAVWPVVEQIAPSGWLERPRPVLRGMDHLAPAEVFEHKAGYNRAALQEELDPAHSLAMD